MAHTTTANYKLYRFRQLQCQQFAPVRYAINCDAVYRINLPYLNMGDLKFSDQTHIRLHPKAWGIAYAKRSI